MSNSPPSNLPEGEEYEDKLSNLPDDILVSILSLIDRKDATRSSILSRRWRYMATYFTSLHFCFPLPPTVLSNYWLEHKSLDNEKQRYMDWVNQVVSLHRAPFINDFRICLPFDARYSSHINNSIKFAISKRVKNLELDFTCGTFCSKNSLDDYSLPSNIFKGSGSAYESGISYLTSISLKNVDISTKVLELLMSRCHSLEQLQIESAPRLSNVKIISLSEKFKYLAIRDCFRVYNVEIHAVSLQSFEYKANTGRETFVYASAPSLVEACFEWCFPIFGECLLPCFLQTKSFPAQLSKLSLHFTMVNNRDLIIPSFPNVKYLELQATVQFHENVLLLMRFAEACPLLHDLKLELNWICTCAKVASDPESGSEYESDTESENESDLESELGSELENDLDWENMSNSWSDECSLDYVKHWLETQEGTNATLPNLRKLEWSGSFSVHDVEEFSLALYCIKNATILQKFICDPRDLPSMFVEPGYIDEIVEGRRQRARKLAVVVPSHIEYVIL